MMKPLRFKSLPMMRQVRTKRSSLAGRSPSSGSSSTLASRSSSIERASDHAAPTVPGAIEDLLAQLVGLRRASARRDPARPRRRGDPGQPIAGHPAHGGRMGVDALLAPVLPGPGIGLHGEAQGLRAERLQAAKQGCVAHARQPLVDEHLRGGENDAAVGVVLQLLRRLVADAHRPLPGSPRGRGAMRLVERIGRTMP